MTEIKSFSPEMHGWRITCKIGRIKIKDAMIWDDGSLFHILQNVKSGNDRWAGTNGYKYSWWVGDGSTYFIRDNEVYSIYRKAEELPSKIEIKDYEYYFSSKLGGEYSETLSGELEIEDFSPEGAGFHVLTKCGVGLYVVKK